MRTLISFAASPCPSRSTVARIACAVVLFLTAGTFLRATADPGFQPASATLPLSFEENRGQAPADVKYVSRTASGVVLLRAEGFSLNVDGRRPVSLRFVGGAGADATFVTVAHLCPSGGEGGDRHQRATERASGNHDQMWL